jgi:signal transduction histidine kinase
MLDAGTHEPDSSRASSATNLTAIKGLIFGTRRRLWIGLATVLAPLVVLLVLQYRWLGDLERDSAIARRASLDASLAGLTKEVHYYYLTAAERLLNLPAEVVTGSRFDKAAQILASRDLAGFETLFVVAFRPEPRLLVFEPRTAALVEPEPSPRSHAILVAVAPWSSLATGTTEIDAGRVVVDENDPQHRIVFSPVTDEDRRLIGLAGFVVDADFFIEQVLPDAVSVSLPAFDDRDALWVCVRDGGGRQVYPAEACSPVDTDHVMRYFSFIFTDWTVSLHGNLATPERWARGNFAVNVTLSTALAVVLLGGIVFTVRTAIREMRLSAMKNEFVSNVSHELRTPLASIRVFAELMRRGRVDDPTKVVEYGTHIEIESRRLSQLINNILDFSRIESGEKVYSFEPSDIEEVLETALATFAVRLRDRGFELEYESGDEPIPMLFLDVNAIDRAVANLLDNAVKYSRDSCTISVRLERSGDEVVISVADRGIGIPPDEQERIFDRFHRVGTGLVHDVKGSGLGLALVRHIVTAHGGRVTLDSEVGVGSTFSIHLPIGWTPERIEGGEPCRES